MAVARIEGDRIVLDSEWRERELCRQVPGCKYDDVARKWHAPLSWATCVALRGVFQEHLRVADDLNAWATNEIQQRIGVCMSLRQATGTDALVYGSGREGAPGPPGMALEPMQEVAVDFLATSRRALLGDGMGSGKTIETICAVEEMARRYGDDDVFPCLVVPNNSMVYGWAEEIAKWAPHRTVAVLKGGAATRRKLIERMKPCPVHGAPRNGHTLLGCAAPATNGTGVTGTQTTESDSDSTLSGGMLPPQVQNGVPETVGLHTSDGRTGSQSKIMPGCYTVKDSNVVSVVKSVIPSDFCLSIIATRQDGCVVFSVNRVTSGLDSSSEQTGSTRPECTCADRIEVGVINWEGLAGHTRLAGYGSIALSDKEKEPKELNEAGIRTVVADEAHRGKSPKAKQTRAWWWLSWRAMNSIAMSGTPTDKTPESLWSIMHGVCPEEWPAKGPWIDRYCTKSWGYFGGLEVNGLRGETREELYKYLDPRFIRRPTQVVCPSIAEKLPVQVRRVDLPPKQRRAYDAMKKEMLAELEDGVLLATDPISKLLRLSQLASAFGEVTEETIDEDGKIHQSYVMTDPSCKADALMDLVEELDDDPVVVFTRHRQLADVCAARLEKAGVPYGLLTGMVPSLERAQNVQRFQAGELAVMLCTLGAGAESVTLTRARHVAFLQRGSLLQNKQAEDRVWRRGQDRPVQPIVFVGRNTIEESVMERGGDQEEAFQEVVRDEDTLRRMLAA